MHFLKEKYFSEIDSSDTRLYFGLIIFVTIAVD